MTERPQALTKITPVRALRHFLPWVGVLVAFGFLVSLLPETTKWSILITQIPLVPVTGLVIYRFFRPGELSEKALRTTIAFVALAGLSFAIYLGATWAAGEFPSCSTGGCTAAQYSDGAELFFGIRTTTVGMTGYTLVLLSLLIPGNVGRLATAFLGTFGFATSMYLTFYSATELNTTCQWCLGSAAAMTTIFALSYWRLFRFIQ
jgi:uncharacterized membrane protein